MASDMKLWRIDEGKLTPVEASEPEGEWDLEEWIVSDSSVLADDLLIIGRQVESALGGTIDLLAMDRGADLVVIELKPDRAAWDTVAQVLHYGAWVQSLSWEQIDAIGRNYLAIPIQEAFEQRFGEGLPETVNLEHRMIIVAREMNEVSESIVRYLSEAWTVGINVLFLRLFADADRNRYLARTWLIEPSELEERKGVLGKRSTPLSFEQLRNMAEESKVVDLYDHLVELFEPHSAAMWRTKTNICFAQDFDDRREGMLSMYPGHSSQQEGLFVDLRVDKLAQHFGVPEETIRAALPGPGEERMFGELHYFKSADAIDYFMSALVPTRRRGRR